MLNFLHVLKWWYRFTHDWFGGRCARAHDAGHYAFQAFCKDLITFIQHSLCRSTGFSLGSSTLLTHCTPQLFPNVVYVVAVGRLLWLSHLGDAFLLEKGSDYPGTTRRNAIFLVSKVILEMLPVANGNGVFYRMSLYRIAFTCTPKGNGGDFPPLWKWAHSPTIPWRWATQTPSPWLHGEPFCNRRWVQGVVSI